MNEAHRSIARLRENLILLQEMLLSLGRRRDDAQFCEDVSTTLANLHIDRARHIQRLEAEGGDFFQIDAEMARIRAMVRESATKL